MDYDLTHGLAVASRVGHTDPEIYLAALLHDVLEDTGLTFIGLVGLGVPFRSTQIVYAVSRRKGEAYRSYIERVATSGEDAVRVKVADLETNLARMDDTHETLRPRYEKALALLQSRMSTASS